MDFGVGACSHSPGHEMDMNAPHSAETPVHSTPRLEFLGVQHEDDAWNKVKWKKRKRGSVLAETEPRVPSDGGAFPCPVPAGSQKFSGTRFRN